MKCRTIYRAGRALGLLALALALLAGSLAPAAAQTANTEAADRALAWIKGQQQADGSFPGFGAGSTADAIFAIAARGQSMADYTTGGKSPLDFSDGLSDLILARLVRRQLRLALQLDARKAQRFGLSNELGVDLGALVPGDLAAFLEFIHALLQARFSVDQSFSGVTHESVDYTLAL